MSFQPSPTPVEFGDIVADVCNMLRPILVTAVPDVMVGTDMSAWTRPTPHVQVIRVGGVRDNLMDRPELEFQVRAKTADDAQVLAEITRGVMFTAALKLDNVKRVQETAGLYWLQDVDGDPRYLFTHTLTVTSV